VTVSSIETAINIDDLKHLAKRRLPKIVFDYIESGAEDDLGLLTNQSAFERMRFVPRYYVDTSKRHQRTVLFGHTYNSPFGIAPMGMMGFARRDADVCLASAAADAGIPYILSTAGNISIETAAKLAPQVLWIQLYQTRDRAITLDLIKRAYDCGVATVLLTCDVPVSANRERNRRNGFGRPARVPPSALIDAAFHPSWAFSYFWNGGLPMMECMRAYAKEGASAHEVASLFSAQTPDPSHTWKDFEVYRRAWPGKLLLKGVLHPEDALIAKTKGADGLVVSNHGARQLDASASPLDVLPLIRQAVGPDMPLLLDGGVRRGWQIVAAICAGADLVLTGRSPLYGAAAGGLSGARKAIAILQGEIDTVLAQIGSAEISDLRPNQLLTGVRDPIPTTYR
jgi:L-lactate dehydrogenase (cytochrome)/(S)-mandelate dehydrogenase